MKPFGVFAIFVSLLVLTSAVPRYNKATNGNSVRNYWKPTEWLSVSELESLPSLDTITLQKLEEMTLEEGAVLINKMYHLSQIKYDMEPTYLPEPQDVPTYIVQCNGEINSFSLDELKKNAQRHANFGKQELTVFITGYPNATRTIAKANKKLVEAYVTRYGAQKLTDEDSNENINNNNDEDKSTKRCSGVMLVIDLGATLKDLTQIAELDIEGTGRLIGKSLVEMTDELDVPQEIIHVVAQGISAHVAGAAGRAYSRLTGHQLRRITALDPSKIVSRRPNTLIGLARGDAEFVDAIHTSAYGLGTARRVGDVDFYPNGPSTGVPGADNVVEATMRATRYFAETARPGNERNFPAVAANSLKQYKQNNGNGRRAYMGIGTEYDVEGDYVLQVNPRSPFGQRSAAQKQASYHSQHQPWRKSSHNQDLIQDN